MVVKAYVPIEAEAGQAESVALALESKPGILAADVTLGLHDIVVIVEAADAEAVAKMVLNEIVTVEGIAKTTTCLVTSGKADAG